MYKLYNKISKRRAKKYIGSSYNKLSKFNLTVGSIYSSCIGWNDKIVHFTENRWYPRQRGYVVVDYDIIGQTGNLCSWMNCCSLPESKDIIVNNWKIWLNDDYFNFMGFIGKFIENQLKSKKLEDIFDDNGCVNIQEYNDFLISYNKK